MTTLDAWLYGEHVAVVEDLGRGRVRLAFTPQAFSRWGQASRVVGAQLPLTHDGPPPVVAGTWLRGLLPEGRARLRLAEHAGVDPDDALAFLAHYGRDTAGALVLVPQGEKPDRPARPLVDLTEPQIAALLAEAAQGGAAHQASSLAGLETKIVLTRTATGWSMPAPQAPSTHIVKLSRPAGSLTADLIDTEVAALELARRCKVGDVQAWIHDFAGTRVIMVRRYDRKSVLGGATVSRLHQEDAAQMLGINTDDPARKFQYGKRLPSLKAIAERLTGLAVNPARLLELTTFNVAVGNVDAHAKNISVLHLPDGRHRLAPAYDVAMHLHQATGETRCAMDVAGENDLHALRFAHLLDEALAWGLTRRQAVRATTGVLSRLELALQEIDRGAHPGVTAAAWQVVQERVAGLLTDARAVSGGSRRPASGAATGRAAAARQAAGRPGGGRFVTSAPDLPGPEAAARP